VPIKRQYTSTRLYGFTLQGANHLHRFHQTIRLHITRRQPSSPILPVYTASHYKAPTIFTDSTRLYGFTLQGANHLHQFHQIIRLHITRRQPSSPIPPEYTASHYKAPTIFTDSTRLYGFTLQGANHLHR